MRFYIIIAIFLFFSIFAWKDWFKSLCVLVVSMAIMERPDMPRTLFGISGLGPWNVLFANVVLAFGVEYIRNSSIRVEVRNLIKFLFLFYIVVIFISYYRGIVDLSGVYSYRDALTQYMMASQGHTHNRDESYFIDQIVNVLKYMITASLFFYGANNEKNIKHGLMALSLFGLLLAVQVVKTMPISSITDAQILTESAVRKIDRDIGYYRSDAAILFGGTAWVLFLLTSLFKEKIYRFLAITSSALTTLAMALTGGRIGIGSWMVAGSVIILLRHRKMLLFVPILVGAIIYLVPAAQDRFLQGIGDGNEDGGEVDYYSATSGRAIIWPYVIDKIYESPIIGYGRNSMQREGVSEFLFVELGEIFSHPHNAYLELLMDNGLLMGLPIILFYFYLLHMSYKLFKEQKGNLYGVVGGVSMVMLIAHLVGFMGLQSFYPLPSMTPLMCSVALMLRASSTIDKINEKKDDTCESKPKKKRIQYYL